jgi:hypothetical protein
MQKREEEESLLQRVVLKMLAIVRVPLSLFVKILGRENFVLVVAEKP